MAASALLEWLQRFTPDRKPNFLAAFNILNAFAAVSRANQRKGCPVEGGGGGTVDDCPVGRGGLRGGTAD